MTDLEILYQDAVLLLQELISIPSYSKEEDKTADAIERFLQARGVAAKRSGNNVWAVNQHFDQHKYAVLLNSHHDTVRPNKGYTRDPFLPSMEDGKLYGLGSNDAGASLVSLIACFLYFYAQPELPFNIVLAATAEEEISGLNGIEKLLPELPEISFGIVGEPTLMNMAVAERGLLVVDAVVTGVAGHAARNEGVNALYKALEDIEWIRNYRFDKTSEWLGEVKMTVTSFHTENTQHNVVPAVAEYLIDVRVNECYTFEEILDTLKHHLQATIKPRSTRLRSSSIPLEHPLVKAGLALGRTVYGSPTTSDKALMPFSTLKMGPGDSARSHTADEFIWLEEIQTGIALYIQILKQLI